MSDDTRTGDKPKIEFSGVQAVAAPLAAVTSAVLLSTFGVAGTLIGAALGSLVLTVGNALYTYSIKATRQRVATAQASAASRIARAQSRVQKLSTDAGRGGPQSAEQRARARAAVQQELAEAQADLDEGAPEAAPGGWRALLAELPWKRIALVSLGVFVAAVAIILAFELATGKSVSSYTGSDDRRTSIPGLGGRDEAEETPTPPDEEAPADEGSPSPDEEPSAPAEDEQPTPTVPEDATTPAEPTPETVVPDGEGGTT